MPEYMGGGGERFCSRDSFNIETAPAFILLQRGHELWRQVGELTIDELKLVLEEFK